MRHRSLLSGALLGFSLVASAALAACGGGDGADEGSGEGGSSAQGGAAQGGSGGASGKGGSSGKSGSGGAQGGSGGASGSPAGGQAGSSGKSGGSGSAGASGSGASGGSGSAGASGSSGGSGGAGKAGSGGVGGSSGSGGSAGKAGSSGSSGAGGSSGGGQAGKGGSSGQGGQAGQAGTAGGAGAAGFDVQPSALQTLTVPIGQTSPTVTYTATLGGLPVTAAWSVDHGNIGLVPAGPSSSAVFSPTGTTGGMVSVVAGHEGQTVQRQVLVKLTGSQNGVNPASPVEMGQVATDPSQLTEGGGVGGVGGEGLGPAVTDPGTLTALGSPTGDGSAQGLRLLYPYDKTVFPRGMLAPLLMWDWADGDADAIEISLTTTSGSFSWQGTFAKPAILAQTGGAFIRHPIPQDIWKMATDTAGGATPDGQPDRLQVSLTVAKGGKAYGPVSETWTVAPTRLSGIIYYQSYGTRLAKNYGGAVGGDHLFGGAVLSIHVGDTAPKLVANGDGSTAQCRVCHSVSAKGSRLVAQQGDNYAASSAYDLTPQGAAETPMPVGATFPGLSPDGSIALSPSGQILTLPNDASPTQGAGLETVSTNLGTPAFSPDGTKVVFNPMAGPLANPTQKLVVMNFNAQQNSFSAPVIVADYTGSPAETRPGWPAFFPDSKSVVFEQQSAAGYDGNGDGALHTRKGAKGLIAWASPDTAGAVVTLDALNGGDGQGGTYLPKLSSPSSLSCTGDGVQVGVIDPDHGDDVNVNYEPTVNPVASGGYAWVVFTSRRMYGNEATIPPFCSDPRGVDLVQNITPKKLWVAAVDLNAQAGADPSHPAFYLPAQELLAGNARGFWVLDPCRSDGDSCESGDQCCNGYCEPGGSGGALVCSNTPPNNSCSHEKEKCTSTADCCDPSNQCVGGFCAQGKP